MPPLRLLPTGQFEHGMTREYRVVLPSRETALLTFLPGRGWELTIQTPGAESISRGLFATAYDALCLLSAEYRTPLEPRVSIRG
jgi:hypothetical protein